MAIRHVASSEWVGAGLEPSFAVPIELFLQFSLLCSSVHKEKNHC